MTYTMIIGPWDGYKAYINAQGMSVFDEKDSQAPNANTVLALSRDSVFFWFPTHVKPTNSRWIASIAHEALHATIWVLYDRGLKISLDTDEAATYYTGWLVEKMVDLLKER